MEVFKFGGASVSHPEAVRNLLQILKNTNYKNKLVVISAMGKTTNALEKVVTKHLQEKQIPEALAPIQDFHSAIMTALFEDSKAPVFKKVASFFNELENFLTHNKSSRYDYVYDQIIGYGELISTTIVSEFLRTKGLENNWLDARECIKTNDTFREAQINWENTQEAIQTNVDPNLLTISQGFIGTEANHFTTSLGREGSDYSAAIFAFCLNAESLTIWKDVPGVLNGDPRQFPDTKLLHHISYEEAIELAFYGASVIHPKTLQPLKRKEIPLFVRSFKDPAQPGTKVSKGNGQPIYPLMPCFIVKKGQVLISLSSLDFSFMVEENISEVFKLFHQYQMKVDLIQNSAISFSVCVDNRFNQLEKLIQHLKTQFKVEYTPGVSLFTVRHFNNKAIAQIEKGKKILLKQVTKNTLQMVTTD